MFQALFDSNENLGGKTMIGTINRCTDYRGKFGINQHLTAHYNKNPGSSWIAGRWMQNPVQIAAFQGIT